MGVLKPGDAEFDKVIKEVEELKADNRIMTPHDAEISSPITERRDFPHFSLEWVVVDTSPYEVQIVFHFKKLSRMRMRRLHEYLPGAIFNFFGGERPCDFEASESLLGETNLEYRSQYDMSLFRVPKFRKNSIIDSILKVVEAFPG